MAWRSSGRTNAELISNLYKASLITSSRVRDAMVSVDRAHYSPDHRFAYEDSPQSIGFSATISAPHMHASAAELHQDLIDQLKSPGRMFIPVEDKDGWGSQWIWVVDKDEKGKVTKKRDMGVRYVPLTDRPRDAS